MVLTDGERALPPLPAYREDRDGWLTALWAAKEAAAKAEGRGLQGRPKDFEATITDGALAVAGRRIGLDRIENEGKEYVVAWTTA
jgi:phosphopantetheinyl transferase